MNNEWHLAVPASCGNVGPGFDCFGLALGVYNRFSWSYVDKFAFSFSGKVPLPAAARQPTPTNYVYKSYAQVCQLLGQPILPLRLHSEVNIPLQAGLGSSGCAIVAGVTMALIAAKLKSQPQALSSDGTELLKELRPELMRHAAALEGHPDNVAASIYGGFTISYLAAAETYESRSYAVSSALQCLLLLPVGTTKTAESRGTLPQQIARGELTYNLSRAALVASCFATKNYSLLSQVMFDKLHEPYRDKLYNYQALKADLLAAGAVGVALSGSGPAVLVLFSVPAQQQQLQAAAAAHFKSLAQSCQFLLLAADNHGTQLRANCAAA